MANRVFLLGHVGKDPETKHFDNGQITNFSMATTERGFTTKAGVKVEDRTSWHNISVRGGLAKVAEQYVKKGDQLYVEGKIITRSYDKDGEKRYATEIQVDNLEMIGKKGESGDTPRNIDNAQPKIDDVPF